MNQVSDDLIIQLDDLPPPKPQASADEKTKQSAKSMARARCALARQLYLEGRVTSWDTLADETRIPLIEYHEDEFTSFTMEEFLKAYIASAGETIRVVAPSKEVKTHYERSVDGVEFGDWRRLPQQEKCINFIIDHFWKTKDLNAILLPLDPGDGKGVIASILARYVLENVCEFPTMNNVILVTKKPVKTPTIRKFAKAGISEDDLQLGANVVSYNDLSSKEMKQLFKETLVKDPVTKNETIVYTYKGQAPDLLIIDESQTIKKPTVKAYRILMSFIEAGTKILFMSATPGVTVADMSFFALASGMKDHEGQIIAKDSWPVLARYLAQPVGREMNPMTKLPFTGDPKELNPKAMERFNAHFARAICRPPRDKKKNKVTNIVCTEKMPDHPELMKIYYEAEYNWLDAKARAGESISEKGIVMARFQVMRMAAEMLMVDIFVQRIEKDIAEGCSPVIFVWFLRTLQEIYFRLIDRGILKREQIALIFGGEQDIKLSEIYGDDDFVRVSLLGDNMNKQEQTKLLKTKKYMVQRLRLGLDSEENEARTARIREHGLYKQKEEVRQRNMDDFQDGRKICCIGTASSGGTGVDLDHQTERARPRRLHSATCFYGEEFLQVLGRCDRKGTISNVDQEIIILDDTIIATHVFPTLTSKMHNIRTIAAGNFDLVMLMEQKATLDDIKNRISVAPQRASFDATDQSEELAKMEEEAMEEEEEEVVVE